MLKRVVLMIAVMAGAGVFAVVAQSTLPTDTAMLADVPNDNKLLVWISAHAFYILFFFVSLAIIAGTFLFYIKNRDTRRFLTSMRLSVLDRTVQKGCRYIESNFSNSNFSAKDVCRALVIGDSYLEALFVKEIGIGVDDFITQVRINGIKYFLAEDPSQDLEKICVKCGFSDKFLAEGHFKRLCGGVGIEEYARALQVKA